MRLIRGDCNGGRANALWGRGGRGEPRSNALWGRGGRKAGAAVATVVVACTVAATATAGPGGRHHWGFNVPGIGQTTAYIPDSLASAIRQNPRQRFDVIVEGVQQPQDPSQTTVSAGGLRSGLLGLRKGANTIGGSQIGRTFGAIDGLHAGLTGIQIAFLAKLPYVAAIVPNETVQMSGWGGGLQYSNPQKWAWAIGAASDWTSSAAQLSAPTIAVVDSGVDPGRGDFGGRLLGQVDLTSLQPDSPGDGYGHGTFVAGIAAGGAAGYAGVAPEANLYSVKVMNDQGEATVADIVAACDWILQNKSTYDIRVANFSLHATSRASLFFDPLDQAVEKLWLNGVVVVAASGNYAQDGQESDVPFAPGNDPFVITVGAADMANTVTTSDDTAAPWSAWGYTPDGFAKPDLSAPGRYIVGPVDAGAMLAVERPDHVVDAQNGYMQLSGTSFAAPMVAGAAAMLLAQHPDWTPDQVKGALMSSAQQTPAAAQGSLGAGELDVRDARAVQSPPNPNAGLDAFLTTAPDGSTVFDSASWQAAALTDPAWNDAAWSDAAWSDAAWSDAAWASAAWGDAAWSDAAWADAAWADAAWADAAGGDGAVDPATLDASPAEIAQAGAALAPAVPDPGRTGTTP
ncbi:MAG TPA: S8 family serine peptidase [Gaiellaceae bacterium]|nr:S8 family serine peptidase [Gaiellaceae bacterium]